MKIELRTFSISSDIQASVSQMEDRFGADLVPRAEAQPSFKNIGTLFLSAVPHHPLFEDDGKSRSYSRKENYYFVSSPIDYIRWATSDWEGRTDEFACALNDAIQCIAKTRITDAERETLNTLVEKSRCKVREKPPATLEPVGPTFVEYDEHSNIISYGFGDESLFGPTLGRRAAVPPEQIHLLKNDMWQNHKSEMFKLYKRIEDKLHYFEAWTTEQRVIEHWGACGTEGETREHDFSNGEQAEHIVDRLQREAFEQGFQSISLDKHATLVIEYLVDDFGSKSDIAKRHKLEDHLNELTGWLGLGDCDGGSTGSGTMEVFCNVVNYELAKDIIEKELKNSPFRDFHRIYRVE